VTHALAGRTGSAWRTRPERWAALTEPEPARALLQEQLPGFASGELVIERWELHHLRFRTSPDERRGIKPIVAAAYALDVRDERRGRRGTQLLYVATYEGRGRGRFDKGRAVARSAPRFGPPLAYLPGLDAAWQEEIPGAALMRLILDGVDAAPLMDAAGRGLAALHRTAPDDALPRQEPAMRLVSRHGGARELAHALPGLRPRLAAVSARLAREAAAMPAAPPRLVHGDFLLKQLVVHEGRLAVFDFDGLMVGDCLEDVAKCLADLHYWDLEPSRVRALAARFLEAYRAHASWDVPADRLRWHYAVQVLGDAWYWYKRRQFEPAFERELEELLARVDDPPVC